jgi:hypothetical protein
MHHCYFIFFPRVLKVGQDCYGALWKMNDVSTQFLSWKANSAITWTFILQLVVIICTKVSQIWQLSIPSCLWFVVKCPSNTSWGQNDILKKILKIMLQNQDLFIVPQLSRKTFNLISSCLIKHHFVPKIWSQLFKVTILYPIK